MKPVNIRIESRCHLVLRPAQLISIDGDRAVVRTAKRRRRVVPAVDVWICSSCDGPGEMRFRGRCWCERCFDRQHNQPDPVRLEDYLRTHSPTADMEQLGQDLRGIS